MKSAKKQAAVGAGRGPIVGAPRGSPTKTRALLVFVLLTAIACVIAYCVYLNAPRPARFAVALVRTSDGDTVVVHDDRGRQYHVRLYGIDTPELGAADGFRAALYAAVQLEAARRIELEFEPRKHQVWGRAPLLDKYGRVLGWVWYEDEQGREHLLNEDLLRLGLAALYHKTPQGKYGQRLWQAAHAR
jgi:endonuclease YncB( thermonuclease family)